MKEDLRERRAILIDPLRIGLRTKGKVERYSLLSVDDCFVGLKIFEVFVEEEIVKGIVLLDDLESYTQILMGVG